VQNTVLTEVSGVAHEVARRGRAGRHLADATAEVTRLMDAALEVMQRADTIDPPVREIVQRAGLSNQAFYKHFVSKDALLVALLDDGQRRLCHTLDRRMTGADPGLPRVCAWIDGLLAQCLHLDAAAATRPFVANAGRLADRYPAETGASADRIVALLRPELHDERDAALIYELVMGFVHHHLLARTSPSRAACDHLVDFVVRSVSDVR
jgi:AcrR family transcriptional regulator